MLLSCVCMSRDQLVAKQTASGEQHFPVNTAIVTFQTIAHFKAQAKQPTHKRVIYGYSREHANCSYVITSSHTVSSVRTMCVQKCDRADRTSHNERTHQCLAKPRLCLSRVLCANNFPLQISLPLLFYLFIKCCKRLKSVATIYFLGNIFHALRIVKHYKAAASKETISARYIMF